MPFNSRSGDELLEVLEEYEMENHLINCVESFYKCKKIFVRMEREVGDPSGGNRKFKIQLSSSLLLN